MKIFAFVIVCLPLSVVAQLREVGSVITEVYTHNASTYITHGPPLYSFSVKNGDVLSVDQNDNLQRRTPEGTALWQKKFDKTRTQKRAAMDRDENLVVSFYELIQKFDADGNLRWEYDVEKLFNRGFMMTNLVAIDENNNIFLVGQISYTAYLFMLKLSPEGELIWSKLHRQETCYEDITFAPKGHVFMGDDLYFLNNDRNCATLYQLNPHGSIEQMRQFDHNIVDLQVKDTTLVALSHQRGRGALIVHRLNQDLDLQKRTQSQLPANSIYKKPEYTTDSLTQKVTVRYEELPVANYVSHDFLVEENGAITIAGGSADGPWICQLSPEGDINWTWSHRYKELYVTPAEQRLGSYQQFVTIKATADGYSVTGIHNERSGISRNGVKITLFEKQFVHE